MHAMHDPKIVSEETSVAKEYDINLAADQYICKCFHMYIVNTTHKNIKYAFHTYKSNRSSYDQE